MVENGSSGPCSMGDDSHPYTPFMLWHTATPVLDPGPRLEDIDSKDSPPPSHTQIQPCPTHLLGIIHDPSWITIDMIRV